MSTAKSFRISGIQGNSDKLLTRDVGIAVSRRLLPRGAREVGAGELMIQPDEVVRVELENGFILWSRADDLIREHGTQVLGRDGEDVWEIQLRPSLHGRQRGDRGWLGLGIRILDFFGIDLSGKTAHALCDKFEIKQLEGNSPGLYRCQLKGQFALQTMKGKSPGDSGKGPLLIFLHGTASSCNGSFGKLWANGNAQGVAARDALAAKYEDRVYAWEHRSLTQSPIQNALELVRLLPDDTELHLVSHSRGGLVGELLCLAEREQENDPLKNDLTSLFAADKTIAEQLGLSPLDAKSAQARDKAYDQDREKLVELRDLLDGKGIRVTRFVRVACPARGTTLASGRLDRWLSVLDFISGKGLFGDVVDFLLAVVKERTDPRTLPGLEAMMPGSAVTRLLQHPNLRTQADLSVISGDVEGDSLWSQIKLLAADWFYGADHDLVVNTGSMYGGIRRPEKGARFQFDQGSKVCHFNYFENEKSVRWLVAGLTRTDDSDGGFQAIEKAKHEPPRWRDAVRRSREIATPRPLAVVLPGTMGSALSVRGEPVWLNYRALMWGGLERLHAAERQVDPTDILDDFYGPLLEFLARSHRVEIFPYDWRDSIQDAAAKLADKLDDLLPVVERTGQPVHMIAHSMGGLVARAMIADGPRGAALWRRIVALPNSRFMMLGTPNHGSYEAVRWLTGHNPTQAKLSLLDMTHGTDGIIKIVREYPGLLELLPFSKADQDFSQVGLWKGLKQELGAHWETAREQVLIQARNTWNALVKSEPDPNFTIYVAGCQDATVADYRLVDYEESYLAGRKRLDFLATAEGDGTVTWKSGAIGKVPIWYVEDTAHDELCLNRRAFTGYLDLLMTGKTSRLPNMPPVAARAAGSPTGLFAMPHVPATDGIPDEAGLRGFGFGPSRPFDEAAAGRGVPTIRVSIRHGDLAYASHPVMVGHYLGDTIISAEAAVNSRLNNALGERMELGIYPGRLGTHALFFNADPLGKPAGAIVIGLGQVGEIAPNLLIAGVRNALLEYALEVAQWPDDRFGSVGMPRTAKVTCLLVATGAGGMTVRDSISAILRGAVAANGKLVEAKMEERVAIEHIEFLELFEDVAIDAAEELAMVLVDGELAMNVIWPDRIIESGEGGRRRIRCKEKEGWWQRLEIVRDPDSDMLRFIATTDRARAEETLATGQMALADSFIRQASQSPHANPEVSKTLFEMLLPNRLKEMAPKQEDMVLLLDDDSARFPWELLEDRWSISGRPPAVACGVVRQRKTPKFRPHPAHALEPRALVIGNPDLGGWEIFADLPGARTEAQKVVALLNTNGFRAVGCIDERTDVILSGLHKDAWRILHLAGHGVHDMALEDQEAAKGECPGQSPPAKKLEKCKSGMVIGRNTILTPGDVQQMRWVPELVFINCCHLGKTGLVSKAAYGELAANLAMEFIDMGVKVVVAAGWAVDDGAAETFATSFYAHMLAGDTFGRSVQAAREEIWLRFPNVNTWGAYQCYGDPGYQLRGDGQIATGAAEKAYFALDELVADLANHTQWIRMQMKIKAADDAALASMRAKIESYLRRIPEPQNQVWLARADVSAALGFALGEIGAYREAAEWLDKAICADKGDCPIRAVEQAANFHVRAAAQEWKNLRLTKDDKVKEGKRKSLMDEVKQARGVLERLVSTGETVERLNLLGSANKRLAWISAGRSARLEALEGMAKYYRAAYDKDRSDKQQPDPYAFTNWALVQVLAEQLKKTTGTAWRHQIEDECRKMIDIARARREVNPTFWDMTAEADCMLVMLMANPRAAEQRITEEGSAILAVYKAAAKRGTSPRQMESVLDHLDFLIDIADDPIHEKVCRALITIRTGL